MKLILLKFSLPNWICLTKTSLLKFLGGKKSGRKGDEVRVGEISMFPAAAPLPHGGIVKGSGAQPTRKTIGYSYPAGGGEAEERSSLGLRSQVSRAAVWGPKTHGAQLLGGKA